MKKMRNLSWLVLVLALGVGLVGVPQLQAASGVVSQGEQMPEGAIAAQCPPWCG